MILFPSHGDRAELLSAYRFVEVYVQESKRQFQLLVCEVVLSIVWHVTEPDIPAFDRLLPFFLQFLHLLTYLQLSSISS